MAGLVDEVDREHGVRPARDAVGFLGDESISVPSKHAPSSRRNV
jgi:hypothetical protein